MATGRWRTSPKWRQGPRITSQPSPAPTIIFADGFEDGMDPGGDWAKGGLVTTPVNVPVRTGTWALALQSTTSDPPQATMSLGVPFISDIHPGASYTMRVWIRPAGPARPARWRVHWVNADQTQAEFVDGPVIQGVVDTWTDVVATLAAPAYAAFAICYLDVNDCLLDEVHYIDDIEIVRTG